MRRYTAITCIVSTLLFWAPYTHAQQPVWYVSRAEASMIIARTLKADVSSYVQDDQFKDLIPGQWYLQYMLWATENKLIDTNEFTDFVYPHRPVTRAEYIKMITTAFQLPTNLSYQYTDVPSGSWYAPYSGLAYQYALFDRTDISPQFDAHARITHEEAFAVIQKLKAAFPHLRTDTIVRRYKPIFTVGDIQEVQKTSFANVGLLKDAMVRFLQRNYELSDSAREQIISEVNAERSVWGLGSLTENTQLNAAANKHAEDMWKRGYFSHFTPEGKSYVDRIRATGYLDSADGILRFTVGENIAKGQIGTKQVVDDWMESPEHRENILHEGYNEIGVGTYGRIWVQTFGKVEFVEE